LILVSKSFDRRTTLAQEPTKEAPFQLDPSLVLADGLVPLALCTGGPAATACAAACGRLEIPGLEPFELSRANGKPLSTCNAWRGPGPVRLYHTLTVEARPFDGWDLLRRRERAGGLIHAVFRRKCPPLSTTPGRMGRFIAR